MRLRILALTATGLLALGACSGAGDKATPISGDLSASDRAVLAATDCDALADAAQPVFVDLFQGLVDGTEQLTADELRQLSAQGEKSQFMKDFIAETQRRTTIIGKRSDKLDCTKQQIDAALCTAASAVQGNRNVVAESMISAMTSICP